MASQRYKEYVKYNVFCMELKNGVRGSVCQYQGTELKPLQKSLNLPPCSHKDRVIGMADIAPLKVAAETDQTDQNNLN